MSIFTSVKIRKPKRTTFSLSHEVKLSTEFGRLTPFLCMEVLPGDTFQLSANIFARMAPMIAPIMSSVNVYTHFFYVPNRLLWDKWEEFITGGEDGTKQPIPPAIQAGVIRLNNLDLQGTLYDYLGLPTYGTIDPMPQDFGISLLPFKAYQKIWNDYYRDQNLEDEIELDTEFTGVMGPTYGLEQFGKFFQIRDRAWEKDYFTSALPWAQRGPQVTLPIQGGQIPRKDVSMTIGSKLGDNLDVKFATNADGYSGNLRAVNSSGVSSPIAAFTGTNQAEVFSPTINEVRRSIRVQEWFENNARAGSRYIEQILTHFGVRSSDSRLQRAEYLGGGRSPIMISEVLQNSQTITEGENPSVLGSMAGHGVTAQATHSFKRFFEEHGFVIGILSIMPKTSYMQGVHRMWTRKNKFDYAWPEFANLGEQEIKNYEIYAGADDPNGTFGYTPRYAEYKYKAGSVHGDFRSSLSFWHLARIFQNEPRLNSTFIHPNVKDLNRIFAVQDDRDHFWVEIFCNFKSKRPLPYYGIPTI